MGLLLSGTVMGGRLASLDAFSLVLQASWIVKLVLLILASFSIFSWAVIISKWRQLRRAEQDSEAFLEVYHEGSLEDAYRAARELSHGPVAAVFLSGYVELRRMAKLAGRAGGKRLQGGELDSLAQKLAWASSRESLRLESAMSFLATTASATVYIGLFGTVVGIINAFEGIGQAGSASLAVVAPGIAEALIATAVGLFAAIPATIFYNHFAGELRRIGASIDLFTSELEEDLRRYGGGSERPAAAQAAGE